MTRSYSLGKEHLKKMLKDSSDEALLRRLEKKGSKLPPRVANGGSLTLNSINQRYDLVSLSEEEKKCMLDQQTLSQKEAYQKNIENFIGTVKVPVGLAGPLRVNGAHAQGDYYIPLATTEAALVASYHRGSVMLSEAGGCTSVVLSEGISRAPGFIFRSILEVGPFVKWCIEHLDQFKKEVKTTTNHGKLLDMQINVEGNHVYLIFEYDTGDAAGQNMVTFATEAIVNTIIAHCPAKPLHYFVEANLSGDKKASSRAFHSVRGKKVVAEVVIPRKLIKKYLHTSPELMVKYWQLSAMGGVLSGSLGTQGHYANGLAALYLACGQDVACVSESAIGVTRVELTETDDLYAAVTLPSIIVGTVGGGTKLPSQSACLNIMSLSSANAFAEVCAATLLAGELSIKGAICAHHFCRAHKERAR